MRRLAITIIATLCCISAAAQFTTSGVDPCSVRWSEVSTQNFRIIYPRGHDSLAFRYGRALEASRPWNSLSSGFLINQNYRTRMPVILHDYTSVNNGSVIWAPKRIDLYTVPNAYQATAMSSEALLTIHEGRHAAQMQFGKQGRFKVGHWLFGEMYAGALSGIYPGQILLEGDAVVSETALSRSGRGRQASFLNYMMPALECGDYRDFWQWAYGSQRKYAPDYYRAGYMLISGMRAFYDDPTFTSDYFRMVNRAPGFFKLQRTVKKASGVRFKDAVRNIQEKYSGIWQDEAAARAPFDRTRMVTKPGRLHTEYKNTVIADSIGIFSIKSGLQDNATLIRIGSDGKEESIRPFASYTSALRYDRNLGRIYWTEFTYTHRWELKSYSKIRYIDVSAPERIRTLAGKGRYFNAAPSPDGKILAAVEYSPEGSSQMDLFDAVSGDLINTIPAPDSLQLTEMAWIGNRIYAAGLSDNGYGIYEVGQDGIRRIIDPQPVTVECLGSHDGKVTFISDRTGVGELYALDPDNGTLCQLTSSKYGISSASFGSDSVYFSSVASSFDPETYRKGSMIYSSALKDLTPKKASFDDIHSWKVADKLSAQEMTLLQGPAPDSVASFSKPKKYSKIRLPHFHSWAPVYFNYNSTDDLSGDDYYKTASIGATALFQNLLGTGYGSIGYSFHEDPYKDKWRHSAHLNYYFSGWVPVFELSADYNDHDRIEYIRARISDNKGNKYISTIGKVSDTPYIKGTAKVYVPLNFSSSGWRRGLIPQVKYEVENNMYDEDISERVITTHMDGSREMNEISVTEEGGKHIIQSLTGSLRGYLLLSTAPSAVYPYVGIGFEGGYKTYPGHVDAFSPASYIYAYGYLPGLLKTHGFKFTGAWQHQFADKEWCFGQNAIDIYPRGFSSNTLEDFFQFYGKNQYNVTVDYAIPIAMPFRGSLTSPFCYMKRLELVPFADISWISLRKGLPHEEQLPINGTLKFCSFGASLCVRLSNMIWLPFESTIGVRLSYNTWDNPQGAVDRLLEPEEFTTNFLFTISL